MTVQFPVGIFPVPFYPHAELPGMLAIPCQGINIVGLTIQVTYMPRTAHQRQNQFTQFIGNSITKCSDLSFCLLCPPVCPFGRSPGQIGQNPSVVFMFDFLKLTCLQLEGFQLAPLPIRSSLTLRSLNDQLPGFEAFLDVDFIKDLSFLLCRFGENGSQSELIL